jgi:two-component system response regulator NreC
MEVIRVLLVDDHAILREAVGALLAVHDDMEVLGEASNGREAIDKANELVPDVIVMNISLPLMDGLEATRRILKRHPSIRILVLTELNERERVLSSLKAGVAGYLPKTTNPAELLSAIRSVARGDSYLHPSVLGILVEEHLRKVEKEPYDELADREREVLKLIADGFSIRVIGDLLGISAKTARGHKTTTMKKLGIHSHVELVKYAIRKGLAGTETVSAIAAGREKAHPNP